MTDGDDRSKTLRHPALNILDKHNADHTTSVTSTSNKPADEMMTSEHQNENTVKRERRKRRVKPPDADMRDLKCGVCGDKAHGYNFNAVTCESCKAFFRRNALRSDAQNLKCNFEGNCKLDPHTRRFCTECRLRKCFLIGMKKDWILSDEQLVKRRERSRVKKELAKFSLAQCQSGSYRHQQITAATSPPIGYSFSPGQDSAGESIQDSSPQALEQLSPEFVKVECQSPEPNESPTSSDAHKFLSQEEEQIVARLDAIEHALNDTVDMPYSEDQAARFSPKSAAGMFNMADTFIRRFIKFCKCLPEFAELSQTDQIALLKGGIMEVMMLRGALKFDTKSLSFHYRKTVDGLSGDDWPSPSKEGAIPAELVSQNLPQELGAQIPQELLGKIPPQFMSHLAGKSRTELEQIAKMANVMSQESSAPSSSMANLNHHQAINFFMSLNQLVIGHKTPVLVLMLIELFSPDRPNLVEKERVAKIQEYYSHVLYIYLKRFMPEELDNGIFPKLLMKLVDVRELGEASSTAASRLNVSSFEPLLVEIFSLR